MSWTLRERHYPDLVTDGAHSAAEANYGQTGFCYDIDIPVKGEQPLMEKTSRISTREFGVIWEIDGGAEWEYTMYNRGT